MECVAKERTHLEWLMEQRKELLHTLSTEKLSHYRRRTIKSKVYSIQEQAIDLIQTESKLGIVRDHSPEVKLQVTAL